MKMNILDIIREHEFKMQTRHHSEMNIKCLESYCTIRFPESANYNCLYTLFIKCKISLH